MSSKKSAEVGGILLTEDWKLLPVDTRNWELCHRHAVGDNVKARTAGTVGQTRWHRCGRYYSHNTFVDAITYVADVELKRKVTATELGLLDALAAYRDIVEGIADSLR